MTAYKKRHSNINLLPKDPFTESSLGKFLGWALTTGRYIVIFTELIVIVVFVSRFTLDRQINSLNESILAKQTKIKSFEELEFTIRGIQEKGEFVHSHISTRHPAEWFEYVLNTTPADVVYDQLSINANQHINVRGVAFSQDSLSGLITDLKQDPLIEDVVLSTVETSDRSAGISFAIQIQLKEDSTSKNKNV